MSNSVDPDQGRPSVGPDLGPNCLKRLRLAKKDMSSNLFYLHIQLTVLLAMKCSLLLR